MIPGKFLLFFASPCLRGRCSGFAFPIPAMSCDDVDLGDPGGPLPLLPVSPNFTQAHPMSPKPGVPSKPGFGLLGWKVFVG